MPITIRSEVIWEACLISSEVKCVFCTDVYTCVTFSNQWWSHQKNTRKSSCMNARGIPPTAYQVLHLLSYSRKYPTPGQRYPIPGQGTLILTWPGFHPHSDLTRALPIWTWLGYPPYLDLAGVPPWEGSWDQSLGYPLPQKGHGTSEVLWDGDGAPPECEQTDARENSTFPSYYLRGR